MQEFLTYIGEHHLLRKGLLTLIWLIITVFLIRIINRVLYKTIESNNTYYIARKRVYYLFSSLFLIYVVFIWSDSAVNLTTYLGLVSAGVAIALKDLFANLAAWIFIIFRKPFEVSDRILINEQRGDVIDIRMFQFTLMEITPQDKGEQSTGRIVNIPNYYIFTHPLINYNKGFKYIWNEIRILITFESNWKKAKDMLTDIANRHSLHLTEKATNAVREAAKKYMIHYNKLTPIVYTDVRESGVQLTIRYLCTPRQKRTTENNMWEDILDEFEKDNTIQLAYPTMRITKD